MTPAEVARRAHRVLAQKEVRLHTIYVASAGDDGGLTPEWAAMLLFELSGVPPSDELRAAVVGALGRYSRNEVVTYEGLVSFLDTERQKTSSF